MKFNIKKVLLLLIVLAFACVGSVVGYITYTKNKAIIKTEQFPIEQAFIVNIQSSKEKAKVLKTSITLEFTGKKGVEKLTEDISKVNDTLISTLSSKTEEDLGPKKRDELKKDLVKKLNTTLGEDIVVDIFFTDFLIN